MQVNILITGIVQGVGFRKFVRREARLKSLVGWVRNNPDGSVELVAQGEKQTLEEFIKQCEKGSLLSEVDEVRVTWTESKETYTDFLIRHDW